MFLRELTTIWRAFGGFKSGSMRNRRNRAIGRVRARQPCEPTLPDASERANRSLYPCAQTLSTQIPRNGLYAFTPGPSRAPLRSP